MALLLQRRSRYIRIIRTLYLLPIGVALPIATVIWGLMLDPNQGLVNGMLAVAGIPPQPFLTSEAQAIWSVVLIATWKGVAFWMLFLLAGLEDIPKSLYEAVRIDGANWFGRMRYVTLPMLRRTILFVLVADTAANFVLIVPMIILTQGGPRQTTNVLMYEAYRSGFIFQDFGRSMAIVTILTAITLAVIGLQVLFLGDRKGTRGILMAVGRRRPWLIVAWYAVIAIGLIITLAPFVWAAAGSLKENHVIFGEVSPFSLKAFWPGTHVEAYFSIFEKDFGRAIANTVFVSVVSVVAGLLAELDGRLRLRAFSFPGQRMIFGLVLLTFAVPSEAIAIPLFSMMRQIGWFDTFYALIIPGIANGLVIFLYRQFFAGVPQEMIEAARVDGLSWWRVYWTICMPLAKPVTIGAGLLLFVFQWESFLWPLIAAPSTELHLIQVALARFATEFSVIWNEQFAASTIAGALPLIFIFMFQKQFVSALTGMDLK